MQRKGYKCITVNEKIHEDIKKRAQESNPTIKDYAEYFLAKDKVSKKEKK